ncbi:MAG TPA: universal stress protein [Candidatus Acidoferrales bacterium]|nr:universal stress protein [Candidatus Acidoferrales bacterium]
MSTLHSILVPIDGSPNDDTLLDFAVERARQSGARITVAHAVDYTVAVLPTPEAMYNPAPLLAALEDESKAMLSAAAQRVRSAGVGSLEVVQLEGAVTAALVDYLREHSFDAVIMGTHGRAGFERLFLGSTAEGVVRSGLVPVFLLRCLDGAACKTPPLERLLVAVDPGGHPKCTGRGRLKMYQGSVATFGLKVYHR